jgi:lipoprotein NlpD
VARGGKRWWWVAVLLLAVASCGGRKVYHVVRPGDTLARIGQAYGISYQQIARANHIRDPSRIDVGQRLFIPGAEQAVLVPPAPPPRIRAAPGSAKPDDGPILSWPVPLGTVSSGFGRRDGRYHDGIDIAAPEGSAVLAASDGTVVFSASLPGYGNVIILRHANGYVTVYAHNEEQFVHDGQRVRRGQRIAAVGRSGRTTGPNLHFEVRKGNVVHDPLPFFPPGALAGRLGNRGG